MAKKQVEVTAEMLREAYIANLEAKRKPNAEAIADFTEKELAEFIRQYADANFKGIYVEQDHNYYDRISSQIPLKHDMKAANEVARVIQDGIKFTLLDDCTAVISGDGGQNATGAVVLPSTITYEGKDYTLTRIDNGAFRGNHDITSVTIPNTVTLIGFCSFESCICEA